VFGKKVTNKTKHTNATGVGRRNAGRHVESESFENSYGLATNFNAENATTSYFVTAINSTINLPNFRQQTIIAKEKHIT